ncbi:hypothetical protein I553_3699 [Mycobacterium xenopi 4042]|uniref:Uncharacterized protein n=1 Tax=Mycobacterium xenopi 4042 TaxID=1299334 RepID=X7YT91_MYCXE|nr:hypothetical protein I553_3699 [Mycobacterium xenopi 4042]
MSAKGIHIARWLAARSQSSAFQRGDRRSCRGRKTIHRGGDFCRWPIVD